MKKEVGFLIAVLLLVFLVHSSYLNNGFIWLDHGDIELGRTVLPLSQLPKAFLTRFGETNFYRPLVTILNSLDYFIYKLNPSGFHLTNLILHLLVTLSAYFFVRIFFTLTKQESLVISLVMGVHPLSFLPVGAVSYRSELLVTAFTFATVAAYIRGVELKSKRWLNASLFFGLLAFLAKETALFWIPSLIIFWEWSRRFAQIKKQQGYLMTLFAIIFSCLILRKFAVPQLWLRPVLNLNFQEALGTRLAVFATRIGDIFYPFQLTLSDAVAIVSIFNWRALVGLSLLLLLVVFAANRKNTLFSRLSGFLVITLLPSLSIIPLPRFSSPHYSFIAAPALGVFLILLLRAVKKKSIRLILIVFITTLLLLIGITTFKSGFKFKNDHSLFGDEVKRDADFREGHFYLGDYFLRNRKYQAAEEHLKASLNVRPGVISFVDKAAAGQNLAGAYFAQKKYAEAEKLLTEIIRKDQGTNRLLAIYNLALIKDQQEKYADVVVLLKNELNHWSRPEPIILYLKALIKTGKEKEAENILRGKLKIDNEGKLGEIIRSFR